MPEITSTAACVSCTQMYSDRGKGQVPCWQAHHEANTCGRPVFMAVDVGDVGSPCAYHADLPNLVPFLLNFPGNTGFHDDGAKGLSSNTARTLSSRLKGFAGVETMQSVLRSGSAAKRNEVTEEARKWVGYYKEGGQSVYRPGGSQAAGYVLILARPNDPQFIRFLGQYGAKVAPRGKYTRFEKYSWVILAGIDKTKPELGKMLRELLSGENLPKAIGIFALFTGFMTAAMAVGGMARALAAIVSMGLNANDMMTCASLLKDACLATEAADTEVALNAAGQNFGLFLAVLTTLIAPAALGAAAGRLLHWFTKERPATWRRLEHEEHGTPHNENPSAEKHQQKPTSPVGQRPHDPLAPIQARLPTKFERASGMWSHHLTPLKQYARSKNALFVARCGNEASLPHQFSELVTGKVVDVKWKTAHDGPHAGLVVAPEWTKFTKKEDWQKFMHVCAVLKQKGYTFKPPPKEGRLPEPGSLLLGPNGKAFCSDVDKMGMYVIKGGQAVDHNLAQDFNNHPELVKMLNEKVYKSIEMDQHPGQDFFITGVDANGRPIMGLHPKPDEKFLVIMGDREPPPAYVVDLKLLKDIYQKYGIRWPYNT